MLGGRTAACQTSHVLATRTFLFADLREYTTFVERHGDTAAATLIADYRRIAEWDLGELGRWAADHGIPVSDG
jgi:class 3 adenylate cyclase